MSENNIQALPQGTILKGAKGKKYTIKRVLGNGAFGITYLAETSEMTQELGEVMVYVAIKEFFMHEFNSRDESGSLIETSQQGPIEKYKNDFRKEAHNLARINHPNIVRVHEVISLNNTYYIVMQFINGESLDDYISSKGHLSEYEALDKTCVVAKALAYLHDQKMLHLDLKPKNIMLDKGGKIYIIDFGLSKQYDESGEPESSTTIGMGTPGYAPTEQIDRDGKTFQPTIDVYALGATFYKMLTGKTPPVATTILNKPETLTNNLRTNGVSPAIAHIVENAMNPKYSERIQNMNEFVSQLNKQLELRGADVSEVEENTTVDLSLTSAKNKPTQPQGKNATPENTPQKPVTPTPGASVTSDTTTNNNKTTSKKQSNIVYYIIGVIAVVAMVASFIFLRPTSTVVSDAVLNVGRYNGLVAQCEKLIEQGQAEDLIFAKNLIIDSLSPLEAAYKQDMPETYNAVSRLSGQRMKKAAPLAIEWAAKGREKAGEYKDALELDEHYPELKTEALKYYETAIELDESNVEIANEYNELKNL
ncbi:MAG: serine/threonine protein kinase [Bacteroidales bacterium]|nr:serine/threonine protein kinase [Bacteroidales bacterium]